MALRALMAKKKLDEAKKTLENERNKNVEFETREAELEKAIEEATTEEEKKVVEEEIGKFEEDKKAHEEAEKSLDDEVKKLEGELADIEKEQEPKVEEPKEEEKKEERGLNLSMNKRDFFARFDLQTRNAILEQEDVKAFDMEVRNAIKERRTISNVGLTIPEVYMGLIKENVIDYSKLYKHVNVKKLSGTGRAIVQGTISEAVWTECCANLNELDLGFNDVELDCYKVGGYFALCNAQLEDSMLDLANEVLLALTQGIGLALDKAILYGTGVKMPLGIVSRIMQTAAPADYSPTERAWEDLHTSNVHSIASGVKAATLISEIIEDFGSAKGNYSKGDKVWVMNEKTYTKLVAACVSVNSAGAIVAGVNATMPVIGGAIEVLNFVPDNVIVAGYFDLYALGERKGITLATSEHAFFLADRTAFKGTARYDGKPVIAEGFVVIGLDGTTPDATMTFAADTANN